MASPGGSNKNTHHHMQPANAVGTAKGVVSVTTPRVTAKIRDDDRLRPDGSNYAAWKDFLKERLCDAINNADYLHFRSFNATHERIVRSIFISSVDCSLCRTISRFNNTYDMFADVKAHFTTVSRAAQLNLFRCLLRFDIRNHPTTATIGPAIDNQFDALEEMSITLTQDELAGLILQSGLGSDPELMAEVDRMVELSISASRHSRVPNFDAIIWTVDIARQNINHRHAAHPEDQPLQLLPLVANAVATTQDGQPPPAFPHPDNTPDAADFMAMQAGVCWQCRLPDHMLRNCPLLQRKNPSRHNPQQANRPAANTGTFHNPTTGYTPGFQGFYPIVAPASYTGTYPQVQGPAHQFTSPPAANHQQADNYRPQYCLQRVDNQRPGNSAIGSPTGQPAARSTNVPSQDDGPQARIVEIGDLEDKLAQLNFSHADIEMVDTAPIVDSATEGKPAYVTGQGDLHFNVLANQRVTLHGVLYCKNARNTLISLAAFRKANATFS
ncbi:hypothetical protein PCANC_26226 [Puccinia coronata f. sp. avenae]|uniref:CCHC-type domain-containing protein n=1 Tax=Puccinia coronata f. sp. avenae TaxID=200324 RepID=A0A2N5S5N1_9BASI|nr:hypothetical protein PCANC_26226 [Puccinia coronata f. sp. avenae]